MNKFFEWLKWLFWDSWHGREATAYDIHRTWDPFAPALEIGSVRISKWFMLAVLIVAALALVIGLAPWFFHVSFVSQDTLVAQTGGPGCFANVNSRLYVAVNCLLITYMPTIVYTLLLVVAFIAGYVTRVYIERREK